MKDICVRHKPGESAYVHDNCYYRELFALIDVAIIVHNFEGIIADMNDYSHKILGINSDEGRGTDVFRFFAPKYRTLMKEKFGELKEGCSQFVEVEILKKDKEIFFGEIIFKKINISGQVFILEIITDVSEKKVVQEELKNNEELFAALFESLTDIFFRSDIHGNITMISPSVAALLDYEPYEVTGEKLSRLFAEESDCTRLRKSVSEYGLAEDFEVDLRTRDEDFITVSITAYYLYNEYEEPIGIQGFMRDISDRKSAENALRESREELREINKKLFLASRTDPLTGIPNRRDMMEKIGLESESHDRGFSIIIADLDKFKTINDTHGHHMGDEVLIEVSKVMNSCLPDNGEICRWGGEEFFILLPDKDVDEAMEIAEKMRNRVGKTSIKHNGTSLMVTVTMGVSKYTPNITFDECIRNADTALYKGKSSGRNCVVKWDSSLKV